MRVTYPRLWLLADGLVVIALAAIAYLTLAVWRSGQVDVALYAHYASAFWLQEPRFTHLPVEYPPLALLPFSLTLLPLGDPIAGYVIGTAAITFGVYLAVSFWASKRVAITMMLYLVIGEQMLLLARYDLYPAFLALWGLWATERKRFPQAYVWLILGGLVKIFPLILLPVVALAHAQTLLAGRRPSWQTAREIAPELLRGVIPGAATLAGIVAFALWRSGSALSSLAYASQRPIQIESLFGTVGFIGWIAGIPITKIFSFGSENIVGPFVNALIPWSLPLLALGCGAVYVAYARGAMPLRRAFLAVIAVTIITGKVFSPQYILWLLPFIALSEGLNFGWLALCALHVWEFGAVMRTATYPRARELYFVAVAAARNVWLLVLTVRLFVLPFPDAKGGDGGRPTP